MIGLTIPPAAAPAQKTSLPPEADSILSLNNIAGIIALIIAIVFLLVGVITLIFFVGIIFLVFGVDCLFSQSHMTHIFNKAPIRAKELRKAFSQDWFRKTDLLPINDVPCIWAKERLLRCELKTK